MEPNVLNSEKQPVNAVNEQSLSLWGRLWGVVARPGATMAVVAQKPTILWSMLTLVLANIGIFLITVPKFKEYLLIAYEKMPKQGLTPEKLAIIKSSSTGTTPLLVAGIAVALTPLVAWLVYTLIFKLVNLFVGSEAPFKSLYAVSILASVPAMLGNLLRSLLVFISPGKDFQYITTSAAVLLPKGEVGPLFTFLSSIDPFRVWSLVVLAIGAAAVLKTSPRKMGFVAAVLWLLMTGASVLMIMLTPQNAGL